MNAVLERLERGYARMWNWAVALVSGTRGYRYDGEQAAQADQLRETEVSLQMMASATDDPDQVRMASDIEDGAENRLAVLLSRPRLTLMEKRERDAIQAALAARRQGFDAGGTGDFARLWDAPPPRLRGLAALQASNPMLGILLSPVTWVTAAFAVTAGWGTIQSWRLDNAKADLRRAREAAEENAETARAWRAEFERAHRDVIEAQEQAAATAQSLQAERRRTTAARRRDQEIARANENLLVGDEPPAWDRLLRGDPADEGAGPSGGGAPGGDSGGMPN